MLSDKTKTWMTQNGFDLKNINAKGNHQDNVEILRLLRKAEKRLLAESEVGC